MIVDVTRMVDRLDTNIRLLVISRTISVIFGSVSHDYRASLVRVILGITIRSFIQRIITVFRFGFGSLTRIDRYMLINDWFPHATHNLLAVGGLANVVFAKALRLPFFVLMIAIGKEDGGEHIIDEKEVGYVVIYRMLGCFIRIMGNTTMFLLVREHSVSSNSKGLLFPVASYIQLFIFNMG